MCPSSLFFLYFAYGSNLLAERIQINNPSAEFVDIGKLEKHQLGFIRTSQSWRGAVATVIPVEDDYVWGSVWRLCMDDLENLDRQEAVHEGWYFAKEEVIDTVDHGQLVCRLYEQVDNPKPVQDFSEILDENRPSETYKKVIILGAERVNLPQDYIERLQTIPDNGLKATEVLLDNLPTSVH